MVDESGVTIPPWRGKRVKETVRPGVTAVSIRERPEMKEWVVGVFFFCRSEHCFHEGRHGE